MTAIVTSVMGSDSLANFMTIILTFLVGTWAKKEGRIIRQVSVLTYL
jgi:hypothetical protein